MSYYQDQSKFSEVRDYDISQNIKKCYLELGRPSIYVHLGKSMNEQIFFW